MKRGRFQLQIVMVVSILFSLVSTISPTMAAPDVTTDTQTAPVVSDTDITEPDGGEFPPVSGEPAPEDAPTAPELPEEPEAPVEPEQPIVEEPVIMSLTPLDPLVADAACVDGAASIPSVSPQVQDGVTYAVDGELAPGATVVVRASLVDGYAFNDLAGTNWTIDNAVPNSATFTVTFANPDCEPAQDVQPTETDVDVAGEEDVLDADSTPIAPAMSSARSLPMAVGCGAAPYPAPTGSQITNAIDSIVADPTELPSNWSSFTLNISWSLKASANGGDYFTLALPDTIFTDPMYFPMNDGSGNTVACASIIGGVATFVLTDYVEGRSNVSGNANFSAWLEDVEYTEETQVEIDFGGFGTIIITVPGDYEEPGPSEPDPYAWKSGWWTRSDQGFENGTNALTWMINLPASENGFTNVNVTDSAQDGWWFSCDGIEESGDVVSVVPAGTVYSAECGNDGLTVSIPSIPADTNVVIYFYASIEAGAPGPFNNSFTATGIETEEITRSRTISRTSGGGDGQGDLIVTPITPEVTGNVCTDGEYNPQIHAEDGNGVTYVVTSDIDEDGNYTVVATKSDYQTWDDLSGTGWIISEENPEQAIYNGSVELTPCSEAIPVIPTVTGNSCIGGEYTPPIVSVNDPDSGIEYTIGAIDMETGAYTVTATIPGTMIWGEVDEDWTIDSATRATFNGTVDLDPCVDVLPVIPAVDGNVCEGGIYTPPAVIFPGATDEDGIEYQVNQDIDENGNYVVTATLSDGQQWGDLTDTGWMVNDTTPAEATFNGSVELAPCADVVPVAPAVSGNVCEGGTYAPPVINTTDDNGITYEITSPVDENGAYTVVATLSDGQQWGDLGTTGWIGNEETPSQVTYTGSVELAPCSEVMPVVPSVNQAVCTGGALVPPTVDPVDTDGVTYELSGGIAPGATVLVTATLADGYEWPATMPEGWTVVNETTANYELTLDDVACEQVIPAAPIVTEGVCTGGAFVDPTVTLQDTNGISYTMEGDVAAGNTITITATLAEGHEWSAMPEGWTQDSATTATYTVILENTPCIPAIPANPEITETACVDGDPTNPSVTVPENGNGISYTIDGDQVPGGTVVVTATLDDGYEWGKMPEGWTLIDSTTATFTHTFDTIECETPGDPEDPTESKTPADPAAVTALPSTGSGMHEGLAASWMLLATALLLAGAGVITRTSARR